MRMSLRNEKKNRQFGMRAAKTMNGDSGGRREQKSVTLCYGKVEVTEVSRD